MSNHEKKKDIDIKDLPPEETLTPEEKERLAGAGRFRPTLEALEAREMMSVSPIGGDAPTRSVDGMATTALVRNVTGPTAVHNNAATPTGTLAENHKYNGASDASAAVPVKYKDASGGIHNGVLVGDDKSDVIRLYDSKNGTIVDTYNLGNVTGATFQPNGTGYILDSNGKPAKTSSDIEAAARVGNTIYWMTSNAAVIETKMSFDQGGNFTGLTPVRKVDGLWGKIHDSTEARDIKVYDVDGKPIMIKHDVKNGDLVLTKGDQLTLANAMKATDDDLKKAFGGDNKFEAKNYRNIEGFAIRPNADGTLTAYIGFRAPLAGERGEALVLSVKNFQNWMSNPSTTTPEFGTPILLELGAKEDGHKYGGLGIRDIVWSQDAGKFVIIGGIYGVGPEFTLGSHIYTWNPDSGSVVGQSAFKPDKLSNQGDFRSGEKGAKDVRDNWMSLEAIGDISVNADGKIVSIQLLSDDGSTSHGKAKEVNGSKVANKFSDRYFWGGVYKANPAQGTEAGW